MSGLVYIRTFFFILICLLCVKGKGKLVPLVRRIERDDDWSSSLISKKHFWLETIWAQQGSWCWWSYARVLFGLRTRTWSSWSTCVKEPEANEEIGGSVGGFHTPIAQQSERNLSRAVRLWHALCAPAIAPDSKKKGFWCPLSRWMKESQTVVKEMLLKQLPCNLLFLVSWFDFPNLTSSCSKQTLRHWGIITSADLSPSLRKR